MNTEKTYKNLGDDNMEIVHEEHDDFDWLEYLQNVKDKISLDVSKQRITHISETLFLICPNLEYLYLEGNKLTELSKEFFPSLRHLKWLDVRNNQLKTIPNTIVDHPSLQVLLLEGNNIETLPVEIGSITCLRGIQLARNPLVFPPPNIINQGVQSTIDFLRRQWEQLQSPAHIQLISESHVASPHAALAGVRKSKSACKSMTEQTLISPVSRRPHRQHAQSAANLSKCISVRPLSQAKDKPKAALNDNWVTDQETDDEVSKTMRNKRRGKNIRKKSLSRYEKIKRVDPDEVQPRQLRDIWIEKIRQLLLTQETILQQRKSAEALQQWQDETKMMQQINPKRHSTAGMNYPYDTDPEYRKMMSRKDLSEEGDQKRRDSSLHYMRHEMKYQRKEINGRAVAWVWRPRRSPWVPPPINSEIAAIMSALRELQLSQSTTSVSPRSEQKALAQEITKIKEIQRSLNSLKLKNFGQLSSL